MGARVVEFSVENDSHPFSPGWKVENTGLIDPQARLNEMVATIKEHGHRLTPQRMAVLRILAGSADHLSAEEMYEQVQVDFPMTSLATIYKTVTMLKDIGQVLELGFSDDSNHYDGMRPYPHPHLVCIRCRRIKDVAVSDVDQLASQIAQSTGYDVRYHRLDFFGYCPRCRKDSSLQLGGASQLDQAGKI
jgi:Fur family peroxide stress response transcriptional regulator